MTHNMIVRCIDSTDSKKAAMIKKAVKHNSIFASIYRKQREGLTAKALQTFDCLAKYASGNADGRNDNTASKLNTLAQTFEQEQRAAKSMLNNALNRGRFTLHFSKLQYMQQLTTIEDYSNYYQSGRLSVEKIFNAVNKLCRQYYK